MMRVIAWDANADKALSRALPNAVIRAIVQQEVESGLAQLWECVDDVHSAYVVTRLDANPAEWVIVAYEGTGMQHFGPLFVNAAKSRGIPLRAHVTSPVVERLLRRIGLKRSEVILRAA